MIVHASRVLFSDKHFWEFKATEIVRLFSFQDFQDKKCLYS